MTWNYRLVKFRYKDSNQYSPCIMLQEVYYNDDGSLKGCADVLITGDDEQDALAVVDMMIEAWNRPTIDIEEFPI